MTAQRLHHIKTQRRRNVKRFFSWEANKDILRDYFAGLSLQQIVDLHPGKDTRTIDRILCSHISKNWERDRNILNDYRRLFLTLEELGEKYGVKSRERVYQIIEELAEDMEKLGLIDFGKEGQQ